MVRVPLLETLNTNGLLLSNNIFYLYFNRSSRVATDSQWGFRGGLPATGDHWESKVKPPVLGDFCNVSIKITHF